MDKQNLCLFWNVTTEFRGIYSPISEHSIQCYSCTMLLYLAYSRRRSWEWAVSWAKACDLGNRCQCDLMQRKVPGQWVMVYHTCDDLFNLTYLFYFFKIILFQSETQDKILLAFLLHIPWFPSFLLPLGGGVSWYVIFLLSEAARIQPSTIGMKQINMWIFL